ncbi:hypothetical protein COW36_12695 [bacterium (Candidatus Blackallbacteria) CG17_big_fil_post_rev_8_21_14_2_50_48_46]|uniref:YvbH-like oligomerisation region n=1 Tax=bacterium (Candidatus Blackallbacteria) CG17_big_fil_post_rev_8_21_14_2_50_48_46 TaxID=2014261 RepID=A0A2M7G431_9BACT|nr:MAG: hypothetical protein COW64_02565 [bacterium (Candidatus Blackallbacteria) CG18_big_fil_WC_8_21_14_2_50_49_26]PIW16619.1 MAG: hypothetical protein COW36_12695 [bacterium (Candidatus Blackallbacteria) CG17_big_fil_post_rev_8_21_14_2_50_48_46]PIW46127.1 MAG: hypothetical protein COW20_17960 [bacterium (Candidatus Blackallbacteria) CG13_big_fil_rev_8_21_14_2_50_49_14]
MFGKLAADALGISDIGSVISPEDFNKTDSDDYVMHEEGEKIYFLIKSKSDEYCFTNLALIHLDGTSAVSKKRTLRRLSYAHYPLSHVLLETAGTIDLDIEIKFVMGEKSYSIDVNKKQIELLKDLYKSLLKIAEIQYENERYQAFGHKSLEVATTTLGRVNKAEINLQEQFDAVNQYSFNWLKQMHKTYVRKDFGEVFELFLSK